MGNHDIMSNIDYYFDQRDPSILHVVHRPTTTWKDVYAKIDVIQNLPEDNAPVVHLIFHLQE